MFIAKRLTPLILAVLSLAILSAAQSPSSPPASGKEVDDLRSSLAATKSELQQCRQDIAELQAQMRTLQQQLGVQPHPAPAAASSDFPTLSDINNNPAAGKPETTPDQDMVAEKVAEFEQTKVETVSKYKLRVSGMVLMNTYSNVGAVDVTDLPNLAFRHSLGDTGGDFGA